MNRLILIAGCAVLGLAALAISAKRAESGAADALVRLQASTPGTQQIGNTNISGTAKVGAFSLATGAGSGKVLVSDSAGIGSWQPAPGPALPYSGTLNSASVLFSVANTGAGTAINGQGVYAVQGNTTDPYGVGIYGLAQAATGPSYGVIGVNSSDSGFGAAGVCTSFTGNTQGGHFQVVSPTGKGVYAYASATNGTNFGVYGQSDSALGTGIYGYGMSSGVHGVAPGASYANAGVIGETTGNGDGVKGTGPAVGVHGISTAGFWGVEGDGHTGILAVGETVGISARVNGPGTPRYAVYADANPVNGTALYANGTLVATGTKSFRIDHPLDPTNKYLYHYCAEGPEPRNVYQGHVTTGPDGYAWITLPEYYEDINRDPEYTLTVLDSSDDFVLAKVSQEVKDNRFQIRTSKPGVRVSWRVEGIRNDRFVREYGAPVETEKIGSERGKYQHPELYGLGPDQNMHQFPERLPNGKRR